MKSTRTISMLNSEELGEKLRAIKTAFPIFTPPTEDQLNDISNHCDITIRDIELQLYTDDDNYSHLLIEFYRFTWDSRELRFCWTLDLDERRLYRNRLEDLQNPANN